jgi:Homeodomain-like domain
MTAPRLQEAIALFHQEPKRHLLLRHRYELIQSYRDGTKIAVIVAEFNVHERTVRRIVRKAGLPIRSTGRPRKDS